MSPYLFPLSYIVSLNRVSVRFSKFGNEAVQSWTWMQSSHLSFCHWTKTFSENPRKKHNQKSSPALPLQCGLIIRRKHSWSTYFLVISFLPLMFHHKSWQQWVAEWSIFSTNVAKSKGKETNFCEQQKPLEKTMQLVLLKNIFTKLLLTTNSTTLRSAKP